MKEKMVGRIHIYTGDGKGKTTAAMGLAVRCAGSGGNVLVTQFLKDGSSHEIGVLKQIKQITVCSNEEQFGFVFQMDEATKEKARASYQAYFERICEEILQAEEPYQLLILDEVLDAIGTGMLKEEMVVRFLAERPQQLEVVLTGRGPSEALCEMADYITQMTATKHPFSQGVKARRGIEY